ncbi:hypothetical protein SMC26_23550 [Actinomadura fulvescens]
MAELAGQDARAGVEIAAQDEAAAHAGADGDDGEVVAVASGTEPAFRGHQGVDVVVHSDGQAGGRAEAACDVDVVPAHDPRAHAAAGGGIDVAADAHTDAHPDAHPDAQDAVTCSMGGLQKLVDQAGGRVESVVGRIPGGHPQPPPGQDRRLKVGDDRGRVRGGAGMESGVNESARAYHPVAICRSAARTHAVAPVGRRPR